MKNTWLRMKRQPMFSVLVTLFSAVITVVLCLLYQGNLEAKQHCRELYDNIQVTCTVTNLSGDRTDGLQIGNNELSLFAPELQFFRDEWEYIPKVNTALFDLIENVQIKASIYLMIEGKSYSLAGITSWQADTALQPESGSIISWRDGLDESIFTGDDLICLAPERLLKRLAATDEISEDDADPALTTYIPITVEGNTQFDEEHFVGNIAVAGSYSGQDGNTIYIPMGVYAEIMHETGRAIVASSASATLKSNNDLEKLKRVTADLFATPSAKNAGMLWADGFYLGLEIDDLRLKQAQNDLENSLRINAAAAVMMLALSAGAGFLMGVLMTRNRRREIALMRTVGTTNLSIYFSFILEQMLCFVFGIIVGGAYNGWRPISQLFFLAAVFFIGLTVALVFFLRKNLIITVKEDN